MPRADEVLSGVAILAKAEGKRARRRKAARSGKPAPDQGATLPACPPADIGTDRPMLLLPAPAAPVALLNAATFPAGLVAPPSLGVAITAIAMPEAAPKPVAAIQRPPRAAPKIPPRPAAPVQPTVAQPVPTPAMPLPRRSEPLVTPAAQISASPLPDDRSYFAQPEGALPRAQALAAPSAGLVGAIGAWLSSMGKLIASGFMVTKTRKRAMPPQAPVRGGIASLTKPRSEPPTMRERTEMTQLRAENRRLRAQLEAMQALRSRPEIPRWSERAKEKERESAD